MKIFINYLRTDERTHIYNYSVYSTSNPIFRDSADPRVVQFTLLIGFDARRFGLLRSDWNSYRQPGSKVLITLPSCIAAYTQLLIYFWDCVHGHESE